MASGLVDEIFESSAWIASAVRFANTVPAADPDDPVMSASDNASGEAIADEYTLTFSSVNSGAHTAKVMVQTLSPNNPYRNLSGIDVAIDGSTVHKGVVPGVDLVFSGSGSFSNTWSALVKIGVYLGTFAAFGAGAGNPGTARQHRVHNTNDGAAGECSARLINMAIQVVKAGRVFESVEPFAEDSTEKVAGGGSERVMPYAITVTDIAGGVDLRVDGLAVSVKNLNTAAVTTSNNLATGVRYEVQAGGLQSVIFKLDAGVQVGHTANVMVFEPRYVQIAPDVSGAAGTWGSGDVPLTQAGESAGTVQPGEVAYFWARALVPDSANAESNPYPTSVALVGLETGTAGWVE